MKVKVVVNALTEKNVQRQDKISNYMYQKVLLKREMNLIKIF